MNLKEQYETENGLKATFLTLGAVPYYRKEYVQWLEAKVLQPTTPEVSEEVKPCRNCSERVEPLDKDSPHSFCPKCYC